MSDETKPVPEPGEAGRGDDEIHYHDVDETNVNDAERSRPRTSEDDEQPRGATPE